MYPNQGYPFGSNQPGNYPFGSNMPYPAQNPGMLMPQNVYPPQNSGMPMPQNVYPPQNPGLPMAQQNPFYPQGVPQQYGQPSYPVQSNYPSPPQMATNTFQQNVQYPMQVPQQSFSSPPMQQQLNISPHQQATTSSIKKGRPTVTEKVPFDAANDAAVLRKAMKGFGTDENALINVLCHRVSYQRVEIARAYKTAYGKDLISDIKSETSGNFEKVLVALLTPTIEYYAQELNIAMSGAGTDEDALIEVMCTMSNSEIKQIGAVYYRTYGKSLEETLRDDTSGNVKRLFTSLSVGGRDESMSTSIESAKNDAIALKKAGIDKWGTDESEFNRILCLRNYEQIKVICEEYKKLTGNTLEKDIKREFSGDIEDALLAIVRVANNRPEFFARRLHKSMAGLGTNDRSLIRLCVTRSEVDMQDVKEEFQRYYSKSLKSWIKGDCSGHYRNALLALCGESRD